MSRDGQPGFTLIELLIVVAIIGLIAAIGIPSLLQAIDRGKQKRSMADIRSIATATEAYAVDLHHYPRNVPSLTPVGSSVRVHVVPTFITTLPDVDGWSQEILYASDAVGEEYTILSYGKDGKLSTGSLGRTSDFDCDIIYQGGHFVAWPEGIQT